MQTMAAAFTPLCARSQPRSQPWRGLIAWRSSSPRASQHGLTLIELMVTVGILGVIAVFALPSFDAFRDRERVKGTANNLYADMQLARAEAVQRSRRVTVSFTSGVNWCYGIHEGDSNCSCATANSCNIKVVKSTDLGAVQLVELAFGASDTWYAIDPRRGQILDSSGAAGQGSVTFSGSTGASLRAELNAVGRVRLCSPDGKIGGFPACS